MVINTKNTNYSSGGMLIKYHPFGEVISVLIDNYCPLGGVISVLSVNYHLLCGVISVLSVNYHLLCGVISVNSFSILSFITSYSFIYSIEDCTYRLLIGFGSILFFFYTHFFFLTFPLFLYCFVEDDIHKPLLVFQGYSKDGTVFTGLRREG